MKAAPTAPPSCDTPIGLGVASSVFVFFRAALAVALVNFNNSDKVGWGLLLPKAL
jgi:hypothetical protein